MYSLYVNNPHSELLLDHRQGWNTDACPVHSAGKHLRAFWLIQMWQVEAQLIPVPAAMERAAFQNFWRCPKGKRYEPS